MIQIDTFTGILEKAIIAEGGSDALNKYHQEKKNKKTEGGHKEGSSGGSNSNKRKWNSASNTNNTMVTKQGEPKKKSEVCRNCGKNHSGVCLKGKNACYRCGQEGHIAPNCPTPRKSQGCFACGAADHQIKNCPKKGIDAGSRNRGSTGGKLLIGGPTQPSQPTA